MGNKEIDQNAAEERERHDIGEIESEAPGAQNDFERAEVRDFCRGSGYHEGGRAAETHARADPFLKERDRSAAAGVERHADRRGHKNAP